MKEKITINGKDYTEDELWAIRSYIERWKCEEEAEEIVHSIIEDEATSDPDFARWSATNETFLIEKITQSLEQALFFNRAEVNYDPYAEMMRDYYNSKED